jgi:adenylosuccinate lyase
MICGICSAPRSREIGEEFEAAQVGSSTMPQKRNPINFENAKSLWKIIAPRIYDCFYGPDKRTPEGPYEFREQRTYGEVVLYAVSIAKRLERTMKKISVDKKNVSANLARNQGLIAAEPLYIMLAALGHPDAHEAVRELTLQAQREDRPLEEIALTDKTLKPYVAKMTPSQKRILANPSLYTGIAAKKARAVAKKWKKDLGL